MLVLPGYRRTSRSTRNPGRASPRAVPARGRGDERVRRLGHRDRPAGPSYTVDTLEELHSSMPDTRAVPDRRRRHRRRAAGMARAGAGAFAGDARGGRAAAGRPGGGDGGPAPDPGGGDGPVLRHARRSGSPRRCCAERVRAGQADPLPVPDAVGEYIDTRAPVRGRPDADDARGDRRRDRAVRSGPQGARHRRARPARDHRLHGLLRDLHRPHRPPDEGDPRRHPPGDEVRARHAAAPRRGAPGGAMDPDGLPRRDRPRVHARRCASTTGSSSFGARRPRLGPRSAPAPPDRFGPRHWNAVAAAATV